MKPNQFKASAPSTARLLPLELCERRKGMAAVLSEGVLDHNGPKWSKRPFWPKGPYSEPDFSGISKPMVWKTYMVCVWVAFHENDGNHENDENDEDNSDSYKKGSSAGIAKITETTKMTKTTRIQGANHGFPKPRV